MATPKDRVVATAGSISDEHAQIRENMKRAGELYGSADSEVLRLRDQMDELLKREQTDRVKQLELRIKEAEQQRRELSEKYHKAIDAWRDFESNLTREGGAAEKKLTHKAFNVDELKNVVVRPASLPKTPKQLRQEQNLQIAKQADKEQQRVEAEQAETARKLELLKNKFGSASRK